MIDLIKCQYDKLLKTNELNPHPKNPNKHNAEQIKRLAKNMSEPRIGIRHPIIVSNQSNKIVAGHGRLEAFRLMKLEKVPVVYQDFKDEETEYAFLVSDNSLHNWSELDLSFINDEIKNLGPEFDIDLLGIENFTIDVADKTLGDEDAVPEAPKKPQSKYGDIYEIGNHRLLCGDSTDIVQVEKLMNGEKADMVFTDPPYGMNLDTDYTYADNKYFEGLKSKSIESKRYKKVENDDRDFDPQFILSFFSDVKEVFLWGFDYYAQRLPQGTPIVWDKRLSESGDKGFGSSFELCWSKQKHKREIARVQWFGVFGVRDDMNNKRVHPTQKPVQLAEWFFERWGKETKAVVDLFGGSGFTLIACEKTNRKCFMMEIDPHYVDVIVSRWCKYTGQTKIKRNGEEIDWTING